MRTQTPLEATEGHAPTLAALTTSNPAPTTLAVWKPWEAGERRPRETRA
jgi:hypothetical protein